MEQSKANNDGARVAITRPSKRFSDGRPVILAVLVLCLAFDQVAAATWRHLGAYAGPNVWGAEVTAASHLGRATYTISYDHDGDTKVFGRVTYTRGDRQVTEQFVDEVTIVTDDVVANVTVAFKGVPFGTPVRVNVSP